MALNKREMRLAIAAGAIALLGGGFVAFTMTGAAAGLSSAEMRQRIETARSELGKKEAIVERAARGAARLKQWERQSLPADPLAAKSAYHAWLRALVDRLQFEGPDIVAAEGQSKKGVFTVFPFRLEASASLDKVTAFLHAFYASPHLHQIRRLTLTPLDNKEFKVSIAIEAVSLPTSDRRKELAQGEGAALSHGKLDDYRAMIMRRRMEGDRFVEGRGLFMPYSPAAPPVVDRPAASRREPPKPPGFDHSRFAIVTAIIETDGKPAVWLDVKTLGKRLELGVGDTFEVGQLRGQVHKIAAGVIEIELDGKTRSLRLGDNLHDAVVVPSSP